MRPNTEKLDGPPNMYDDTPLAFVKQMGKRKRSADMDKVSMNERFGTAMVKKFGKGLNLEVNLDDTGDEGEKEKEKLKAQAKANAEAELAKKNYNQEVMPDGRIKFSKSAEGSASGEDDIVPGSDAKVVPPSKRTTDPEGYLKKLIDSGKTREEVMAGSLTSSKYYDLFPSSKETATASDEYYETPTKKIPPPTKTTPDPKPKKKCPPGFAFAGSRGCVKMPKQKGKKRYKKLKQKLSSTKKSTECVFGQKC